MVGGGYEEHEKEKEKKKKKKAHTYSIHQQVKINSQSELDCPRTSTKPLAGEITATGLLDRSKAPPPA